MQASYKFDNRHCPYEESMTVKIEDTDGRPKVLKIGTPYDTDDMVSIKVTRQSLKFLRDVLTTYLSEHNKET